VGRFAVRDASLEGPGIARIVVDAPRVASHALAGQFVIVRVTADGERIPLTICEADAASGTITLIVQAVGRTTTEMQALQAGDHLADVLGPLGIPTEVGRFGTCVVVAGGVGAAIALPVARALAAEGNRTIAVLGARTGDHLILRPEFAMSCDEVRVATEDGSVGVEGLVTDVLAELLATDPPDRVFTVGPIGMMRAVAELTRGRGAPTIASLNPIMVDGTGMCGGCRVTVGTETKFACVDGPEFDAHLVDFASLARRNEAYRSFEACELERSGGTGG
jgi:ferredoxin--NADP+ reductase